MFGLRRLIGQGREAQVWRNRCAKGTLEQDGYLETPFSSQLRFRKARKNERTVCSSEAGRRVLAIGRLSDPLFWCFANLLMFFCPEKRLSQ